MNFTEYGYSEGKPVVYFHGVPGSLIESSLFDGPAREHRLRVLCFDRFAIEAPITGEDYYQHIASAINQTTQGAPVSFIGFSIGSHVALETCRYLSGQVESLHLVSAVAPLDKADFLDEMAGKAVFSLAKNHPLLFRLLSRWQAFLAEKLLGTLFRMLFSSAQGQDKILASQLEFQTFMSRVLKGCFAQGIRGYARDIDQFLLPWSDNIFHTEMAVHLWHGTDDNWSPMGMSDYLANAIPKASSVERGKGLSHYSCLYDAVPKICQQLSGR